MIKATKYIACGVISAIVASGCTSIGDEMILEPSAADYITFAQPTINLNATIGNFTDAPTSRAGLATSIEEFKVWGFCEPKDISGNVDKESSVKSWEEKAPFFFSGKDGNKTVDGADVFSGEIVNVDGSFTSYRGGNSTQLENWRDKTNATYGFIAGVPAANMTLDNGSASTSDTHGPQLKFTYTPSFTNYANQPDAMIAANLTHTGRSRVSLSFIHIMTGLRLKFANYAESPLIITGVTFSGNFYTSATFDFTTTTAVQTVSGSSSGTFTLYNSSQTIENKTSDYLGTLNADGTIDPVTLLLLPNAKASSQEDILATNKSLSVTYKIGENGDTKTFTLNEFRFIPKANSIHTATFSFVGDNFIVSFQSENNWENGSDNPVIIK